MKLYRILTENKNYDEVIKLCSSMLTGYTVIKVEGFWKSAVEHSLIIEVSGLPNIQNEILNLAYYIKKFNNQDAVMVQILGCEEKMI